MRIIYSDENILHEIYIEYDENILLSIYICQFFSSEYVFIVIVIHTSMINRNVFAYYLGLEKLFQF